MLFSDVLSAAFGDARRRIPVPPLSVPWSDPMPPSVTLPTGERVRLRLLEPGDGRRWRELRLADQRVLEPAEPTVPGTWEDAHTRRAWGAYVDTLRYAAAMGEAVPFAIDVDGDLCGQITLGDIEQGTVSRAWIGYWVWSGVARRGVATAACALAVDYAFSVCRLHRVTATCLPCNPASAAVLLNNGFSEEGYLRESLHINGRWQDHVLMSCIHRDGDPTRLERLRCNGRIR